MDDILKLARVQIVVIGVFIGFKLVRGSVMAVYPNGIISSVFLSLPNFFEAITGMLVVTGLLIFVRTRVKYTNQISFNYLYILSAVIVLTLVTLQEVGIINIRKDATYDPIDILFSFLGVLVGFMLVMRIGPRNFATRNVGKIVKE